MPLIKRGIEPTQLSRAAVAKGVRNELECVTNNTLANVIRQLSSLSKHAEDMFGELYYETSVFLQRASQLQERVDRLKVKATQLDSTVEEVSLQDINLRKPFKSSIMKDQQVITISTRPRAISDKYNQCDTPPPLDKLNAYREDGKDSMKFYTDPNYFFELWCQEIQKDTAQQKREYKNKKRKARPKDNVRHVGKVREVKTRHEEYAKMAQGKEFMPESHKPEITGYEGKKSPPRPSSLEVQQGQFVPPPDGTYVNNVGQEYSAGYTVTGNGPVGQTGQFEGYEGQAGDYTQQQYMNNGHVPTEYLQQQSGANHYDATQQDARKRAGQAANLASPRPTQPPPAPPPGAPHATHHAAVMGTHSGNASRESLPPPPPPPPHEQMVSQLQREAGFSPHSSPQHRVSELQHGGHHAAVSSSPPASHIGMMLNKSNTPDSIDLPPPPPPPLLQSDHSTATPDTPSSLSSMPPPPPTPPPPPGGLDQSAGAPNAPAPPPPPPLPVAGEAPPAGSAPHTMAMTNGTTSSANTSANATPTRTATKPPEPKIDERSDLLAAIRTGINLRKTEEQRTKAERKTAPNTGLDVQSIMEAAFEMRRKALEAKDSDDEECAESDESWDSDDN